MYRHNSAGDYTGQIVIGEINYLGAVDTRNLGLYNFSVKIKTGTEMGRECPVHFSGKKDDFKSDQPIVVRLNKPMNLNERYHRGCVFGNFVTSKLPEGFDHAEADEALLYGVWEESMDSSKRDNYFPSPDEVNRVFNIGRMYRTMFIRNVHRESEKLYGKPVYYLLRKYTPDLMDDVQEDLSPKKDFHPERAIKKYIRFMGTSTDIWSGTPRVVVLDEVFVTILGMDESFAPEKLGIKHCIQMEPHIRPVNR